MPFHAAVPWGTEGFVRPLHRVDSALLSRYDTYTLHKRPPLDGKCGVCGEKWPGMPLQRPQYCSRLLHHQAAAKGCQMCNRPLHNIATGCCNIVCPMRGLSNSASDACAIAAMHDSLVPKVLSGEAWVGKVDNLVEEVMA